jgi:hypothetical protein
MREKQNERENKRKESESPTMNVEGKGERA